jgi:hypothetical protein
MKHLGVREDETVAKKGVGRLGGKNFTTKGEKKRTGFPCQWSENLSGTP